MNTRLLVTVVLTVIAPLTLVSCSGASSGGGFGTSTDAATPPLVSGDAAVPPIVGEGGTPVPNGAPFIYAHTDSELYSMDPVSHVVTDIGPFDDGSGSTPTITDLAVDASGDVYVNSETAIYRATLPSGTGKVSIAMVSNLNTTTKFYALGFTPAGALEAAESLIAGDSAGDLYYVPTSAGATPQRLGGFGGKWQLSGDVVFYSLNGASRGLATIRSCTSSCDATNDSLAEIDMSLLAQAFTSKTPATLLKQVLGSGSGQGHLFGIGAWGDSVYAFSRYAKSSGGSGGPAQLVQIGASGIGTSLQTFSGFTNGWSGAGVTTKASVTIIK